MTLGSRRLGLRGVLRVIRAGVVLGVAGGLAFGCQGPESAAESAADRPPAGAAPSPPPISKGTTDAPRIRVLLTSVERDAAEAVTVGFLLVNPDPLSPVRIGTRFAARPADGESLSGVHLVDEAGMKKYFVLRDDQGRADCTSGLGEIPPAGRVDASIRFPAPSAGVGRITVQVPHLAPFRSVPIAAGGRGTAPRAGTY